MQLLYLYDACVSLLCEFLILLGKFIFLSFKYGFIYLQLLRHLRKHVPIELISDVLQLLHKEIFLGDESKAKFFVALCVM